MEESASSSGLSWTTLMSGIHEAGLGRMAAPRSTSIVSFVPGLAKRPGIIKKKTLY
jgi:hypothetical protein